MVLSTVKKYLKDQLRTYMFGTMRGKKKRTFLLRGAPGIGKSDIWRQAIDELSKENQQRLNNMGAEKIESEDCRIVLYNPIDIKGAPSVENGHTKYNPVEKFSFDDKPRLLVFEEFDKGPKDVQNAALEVIYDYAIDGKPLPKNTVIMGTANRISDNAYSIPMSNAIKAGRLAILEVEFNQTEFLNYADKHMHPIITSFLHNDLYSHFCYESTKAETLGNKPYACPRSWEMASDLIYDIILRNGDILDNSKYTIVEISELFKSIIGEDASKSFSTYMTMLGTFDVLDTIYTGQIGSNIDEIKTNSSLFGYKFQMTYEKEIKPHFTLDMVPKLLTLFTKEGFTSHATTQVLTKIGHNNKPVRMEILKHTDDEKIKQIVMDMQEVRKEAELDRTDKDYADEEEKVLAKEDEKVEMDKFPVDDQSNIAEASNAN
jgi:DNA polymerase III delta prime subunit